VSLSSRSRIVQRNGGVLGCVRYRGLAGLFRKDDTMPWRFGRALCDRVRREFGSRGFFTTDELPGYGIGPDEVARIRSATGAGPSDGVLPSAYPRERPGASTTSSSRPCGSSSSRPPAELPAHARAPCASGDASGAGGGFS
jgi:Glu-tRNA(Gln) amidotransferase subunit E-like FAD-binding protein